MSDQDNPKRICPLCQRKLQEDPDAYQECFVCPTKITYADVHNDCIPIPHYEWTYGTQRWFVGPYQLEQDESGLTIEKFDPRSYKTDYPAFEYIMFLEQRIQVDDSNKTLKKIKTIITFS